MSQSPALDDGELYPPFARGDTLTDLMRRLGRVAANGQTDIRPGWDWAVIMTGLEGAVSRYSTGLGTFTGIAARAAVGEALWWIACADEFMRKRVSNGMSLSEYSREIQKTTAGRRLAGLVYLRNRAGHQMAAALMQAGDASRSADFKVIQEDGTVKADTVTVSVGGQLKPFDISPVDGYSFASSSWLPPADSGFVERNQRDACYDDLVASKSVNGMLRAVTGSLNRVITFEWSPEKIAVRVNGSGTLTT